MPEPLSSSKNLWSCNSNTILQKVTKFNYHTYSFKLRTLLPNKHDRPFRYLSASIQVYLFQTLWKRGTLEMFISQRSEFKVEGCKTRRPIFTEILENLLYKVFYKSKLRCIKELLWRDLCTLRFKWVTEAFKCFIKVLEPRFNRENLKKSSTAGL